MLVNRTFASRFLAKVKFDEKATAVAIKPARVCKDCLDSARVHDKKLESKPLTRHDIETLEWKCNGRNCYNKAAFMVDSERFQAARKKNRVLERKE